MTITPIIDVPPFGDLSIYNKDTIIINNKPYESCAKYIYSNLIENEDDKRIVLNASNSNII